MYYFPTIYPDECVYGTLLRYDRHTGNDNMGLTFFQLFGNDLKGYKDGCKVEYFNKRISNPAKYNLRSLILNNTSLKLYAPFSNNYQIITNFENYILEHIYPARLKLPNLYFDEDLKGFPILKCCEECIEEDKMLFGEPFFHKKHQYPGTFVCTKHSRVLDICLPYKKNGPLYSYKIDYMKNYRLTNINNNLFEKLEVLANDIENFIENVDKADQVFRELKNYKKCLLSKGFRIKGTEKVDYSSLAEKLIFFYGEEFLKFISFIDEKTEIKKFLKLLSENNIKVEFQRTEPFFHIIIIRFLSDTIKYRNIGKQITDLFGLIK